jgi:hypothetical protein
MGKVTKIKRRPRGKYLGARKGGKGAGEADRDTMPVFALSAICRHLRKVTEVNITVCMVGLAM